MGRTKEITFWVDGNILEESDVYALGSYMSSEYCEESKSLKAKLVIELPEKKIEITESEFDKVIKKVKDMSDSYDWDMKHSFVKKELGF